MTVEEVVRRATYMLSEADRTVAEQLRSLAVAFKEASEQYARNHSDVEQPELFVVEDDQPASPFITVKQTKHIYALLRELGDWCDVNYSQQREEKLDLYKVLLNNPFITSTKDLTEAQADQLITMLTGVVRVGKAGMFDV